MDKTKFEWLAACTADKAVEYIEAIQQRATMLIFISVILVNISTSGK